jgi:hypothetical protein
MANGQNGKRGLFGRGWDGQLDEWRANGQRNGGMEKKAAKTGLGQRLGKKEEGGFPGKGKAMTGWDKAGNRGNGGRPVGDRSATLL